MARDVESRQLGFSVVADAMQFVLPSAASRLWPCGVKERQGEPVGSVGQLVGKPTARQIAGPHGLRNHISSGGVSNGIGPPFVGGEEEGLLFCDSSCRASEFAEDLQD
jgi:hypothetical protein